MTRIPSHVREQVRQRAQGRCEYCRIPDGYTRFKHHIDHIIAIRHGGTSELHNLALACFLCNSAKSSDIASYDIDTKSIIALYHPRTQIWDEHFELSGALIMGKSPAGRATVVILQINHPDQIMSRQQVIEAGLW